MVENPNCSDFCASNTVFLFKFWHLQKTQPACHFYLFGEKNWGQIARPNFLRTSSGQLKGICKTQILWEKSSFDSLFLVIFIREKLHLQIDFTSICCCKPLRVLMIGSELSMMQPEGQFTMVPCRLQIMRSTVRILNACT